jgi:DNA-binding response OmpR family regulator
MSSLNILIVEDESLIAHDIAASVKEFGFNVSKICTSGLEAIEYINNDDNVSAILMDINLDSHPNGIETISMIKEKKDIPVIYITAYIDEETIQNAIDTKPVSYLTKPFNKHELHASLKLALQQDNNPKESILKGDVIIDETFSFDKNGMQLIKDGNFVPLTKKETELLILLIHRKNQIVPFDVLEYELWPDKEPNENTRRALVSRLRVKLDNKHIDTIVSMGYRLKI